MEMISSPINNDWGYVEVLRIKKRFFLFKFFLDEKDTSRGEKEQRSKSTLHRRQKELCLWRKSSRCPPYERVPQHHRIAVAVVIMMTTKTTTTTMTTATTTSVGGSGSNGIGIGISTIKALLGITILGLGLFSVLAPRCLAGISPQIFSLGNMMASGVLLAAGLVHQLADSAEQLNQHGSFPYANFIAGLTFMSFLILEESVHLFFGGIGTGTGEGTGIDEGTANDNDNNNNNNAGGVNPVNLYGMMHSHSHDHQSKSTNIVDTAILESSSSSGHGGGGHGGHNGHDSEKDVLLHRGSNSSENTTDTSCTHNMRNSIISCGSSHHHNDHLSSSSNHNQNHNHSSSFHSHSRPHQLGADWLQLSTRSLLLLNKDDPILLVTEHHHHEDHIDLHLHGSILASGILMMALSIHSILAGIAIGIETTNIQSITSTAIAIIAHKMFEGFCLGSSLVNSELDHIPYYIVGITFSCATPLGIVIGQIVSEFITTNDNDEDEDNEDGSSGSSGNHSIAIIQAMVAGTFLYIAILEIGAKELLVCRHDENHHNSSGSKLQQHGFEIGKLVCFVGGFMGMSLLALFV